MNRAIKLQRKRLRRLERRDIVKVLTHRMVHAIAKHGPISTPMLTALLAGRDNEAAALRLNKAG